MAQDFESQCHRSTLGEGVSIETEGQLLAVLACMLNPNSPVLSWRPDGSAIEAADCGRYETKYDFGLEMQGFAVVEGYGWGGLIAHRHRAAQCPRGYLPVVETAPFVDYCVKAACSPCESVGNPLSIATGEKKVHESDFSGSGGSPLRFGRSYSNFGHYRPVRNASAVMPGFGDFWRHSYSHRILPEGSGSFLWVTALRPNGTEKHFRANGKELLNIDGRAGDAISAIGSGGWLYRTSGGQLEVYSSAGRLTSLTENTGKTQSLTYSDATTPASIAPAPGLLIRVADQFGRSLNFTYDNRSRLRTMTDPAGGLFQYEFDANQMLTRVDFPDATFRTYIYDENQSSGTSGGPFAISGIFDENGGRYATYRYSDGHFYSPDSTEHGNGAGKYSRRLDGSGNGNVTVTDPKGTVTTYTIANVSGVNRVVGQSQPAGAGAPASNSAKVLDANGNVTSSDNFNGSRVCRSFDAAINLELSRVEGVSNAQACSTVTPAGAVLPSGSRKITTSWHPDWPLQTKVAEPGRFTTKVYNGRPDPFNGNAVLNCAPLTAQLPDGKPIVVLCKQVEQATTDADGRLGMNAGLQAGVPNRTTVWTYNAAGQILTARDALNNLTTYAYYTDTTGDHTVGDLQSVTNAKGQVTNYTKYNKHGQVLQSSDLNGVVTVNTYDLRQRVRSTSVAGEKTTYTYDAAGQLIRVTQNDSSFNGYEYDEAHRQKAVFDSKGNRIEYELDGAGNRTSEVVRDTNGVLARSVTRAYDALTRLQSVTGAAQ
ncbi:MAG: hypothetical protein RLZZ618_3566 [Pseudomonadota bacterium]|jgi:YD repeat-containing protein